MNDFLKKYSNIPMNFINDFFNIAKEEYNDHDIIIDFNIIVKWLDVRHDNLKRLLINKFEDKYDYIIEKVNKTKEKGGGTFEYIIKITPDCFKELCMISQTVRAKEVRKYFLTMEKLIRRYNSEIDYQTKKENNLLKNNQKPKINIKGGVIYVLEAQNGSENLYKIGKSTNIKNRLKNYNSGNSNDLDPLFIVKVDDIDKVEDCIKMAIKKYQYREHKEVYEINIEILKNIIFKCDEFTKSLIDTLNGKGPTYNMKKMEENKDNNKYFIYISK
jgi:phage anti-repressor protein